MTAADLSHCGMHMSLRTTAEITYFLTDSLLYVLNIFCIILGTSKCYRMGDFFPVFIALNREDGHNLSGNDKHDFHKSVDHMLLQTSRKEAIVTVSVSLQELGGWKIKTVLKNLLYPLKKYLSSSDLVPMTFVLCIPDMQNYLEAVDISTTFFSSKQTDQTGKTFLCAVSFLVLFVCFIIAPLLFMSSRLRVGRHIVYIFFS